MLDIVIDTREQRPWSFPDTDAAVAIGTLRTGDYALKGDASFAIERKSLNDFLGTISTGWPRFQRELGRMNAVAFVAKVIIVEGDFSSVCFADSPEGIAEPCHDHPLLTPQFICSRIAELTVAWQASVLFAGNAEYASALALAIFKKRQSQIEEAAK